MSEHRSRGGRADVVRGTLLGVLVALLGAVGAGSGALSPPAHAEGTAPLLSLAQSTSPTSPAPSPSGEASRTVRVGVYNNEPKVFTDTAGRPAGFFVDLLDAIARAEGWRLVWVPVEWDAGLEALQSGRLDLMPDVAFSEERAATLDFNKTPVIESWSQLYVNPKFSMDGFSSLAGKRVAVLDGSVQQEEFQQIVSGLGIRVTAVPVKTYRRAFEMTRAGAVDAAIANRFFGDHFYRDYGLKRSDIVFSLASLYFATGKGRNQDLLAAIDRHLRAWKDEPDSPYYAALTRWLEQPSTTSTKYQVSRWLAWTLGAIAALLVVTTIGVVLSRRQVKAQARHMAQANEALGREQRRLADIVEFLPDPTFVIDVDKRVVAWNRACETMTGVKKEAMLGLGDYAYAMPFFSERRPILIDLLDLPSLEEEDIYKYVERTGDTVVAESFIPRLRGGAGAHLRGAAAPLLDQDGHRSGAIEVIRDVTEQRLVEQALRESEQKYRELVEHANSIILRWTSDGRITFLNEFGQRFFGYSAEEIVCRHVIDTIVPSTDSAGRDLRPLMDQICADPAAFEQNVNENVRPNGERVWIAWTNKIVRDAQGQVVEILSVGTDITEIKKAEDALRVSEQKFMTAFHASPDAIVISRASDGLLLDVNEVFLRQTGYTRAETRRRTTVDLGLWADTGDRERYVAAVRAGGRVREMEARFLAKRGAAFDGLVSGESIDVDGEPCLLTVIRDITERKRTEGELEQHRLHLEELVASRTAELAVAKDRAEAADLLKSAFLATMSHELRTPLNSIIGFTGIMLQELAGPLNPEQRKQLEMVRDSSRHLLALINDVLDISKIEAGQLEVSSEPFDLRDSIEKTVSIVGPLADKKGLAMRVELAPEIGALVSDPRRVEQVLLNLLNNAIKFTDEGGVTLTAEIVSGAHRTAPSAIRISITDTGIGIKPEDLTELFQPFRQVDAGLARQHDGTGLGLAICRRLAELLGGEVDATSEWGTGSVFVFTLPVSEPEEP
jgi:PAS domain S-box-containing protein